MFNLVEYIDNKKLVTIWLRDIDGNFISVTSYWKFDGLDPDYHYTDK